MKIRITEEEKLNIVSLHNENYLVNKKLISEEFNSENGVYYVQNDQGLKASRDFTTKFPKVIKKGTPVYHNYNGNDKKIVLGNTGVVTYCDKNVFIYNDTVDDLKNDGFLTVLKTTFCNGNTLKTWRELTKGKTEERIDADKSKSYNCKNKNPYNALTDGGLNWKQERQKWIDAKCNGTTPCILGNAQTNINLRNAFCEGKWPMKTDGQQTTNDIQTQQTNTETTVTPTTPTTQPTNVVDNVVSTLKQFPNLTFGVKTK